jgi:DNA helicase-2/ATP-dependent DNA helicase PcrA
MSAPIILNNLNDQQREAVAASPDQHLLVLAGAGSGKTRVLVHRITWLIQEENVSPHAILAVTFTNKAAAEMRGRIEEMLRLPINGMWVGTFHGLAHRLLRSHWQEAELPQTFQVLDSEDQYRLIRRILKNLDLDESQWPPKQAQWFINTQKDEGLRSHQIRAEGHIFTETMQKVYKEYEGVCQRGGLVDFAELLLRSYELWTKKPDLLAHYQQRFQHILVDEFQDTNAIQYAWLKLLAGETGRLMMVGDDDQSIYSWRGAKVGHILSFNKDFAGVKTVRLEQNYRSTKTILEAANSIIANNSNRLGKELWTSGKQGELISLYAGFNDIDEARFIVSRIRDWINQGGTRTEIAILYRSNAQSRVLEEQLMRENIPYRVYGGFKYFERAEVKDALAYMRLVDNLNDDGAFERVINTPTRGIGNSTLEILRECAKKNNISLWQAAESLLVEKLLATRAATCLIQFLQLIQELRKCRHLDLSELTEIIIHKSGLHENYSKDRSEKGLSRVENLEELINATQQYQPEEQEGVEISALTSFLAYTALETGEKQAENFTDSVHLMTLHAAKGLEFPLVFLSGMEEGLFPHKMSAQEPQQLEEERRLCYVGMTRAMQKLFLTYAECRRLHGDETYQRPSRFIQEVPGSLLDEVRLKSKTSRPITSTTSAAYVQPISMDIAETLGFRLGQRVKHAKFGEGLILNYEGQGEQARVQVKFNKAGVKWLVSSYAKLEAY